MNNPNGITWPLPADDSPPLDLCITLQIPNRADYYRDLVSLINMLTYWYAWDRDPDHRGRLVAQTWKYIRDSIRVCGTDNVPFSGTEGDDCMGCCLRFHNGVLQVLQCGEWVDVEGQPQGGVGGPGQPGGGSDQPQPGGGCVVYHASMVAAGKWLLPTQVNSGDTLEITAAVGAGTDGIGVRWFCPDGSQFFAGICVGGSTTDGADPLPSDPHMALIYNIDGTYYYQSSGPFTVPSGVVNGVVTIQLNDGNLADNSGSYTFDVQACNNQAGESNTLTLSYAAGTGPTTITYDVPFTAYATNDGGHYRVTVDFPIPVKLSIVGQSDFVITAGPSDVWLIGYLSGTHVVDFTNPPNTLPTEFPPATTVTDLGVDTGAGGAPYNLNLLVSRA